MSKCKPYGKELNDQESCFYVYFVECADKTYYCGWTKDLKTRISEHNSSKKGAKYTMSRRPVRLVYTETFKTKSQALKREAFLKKLSRKQKEKLIIGNLDYTGIGF